MNMKNANSFQPCCRATPFLNLLFLTLIICFTPIMTKLAHAGTPTPEGKWKTISDKTGKPTSIVRIWSEIGNLFGKGELVIPQEGQDPNPLGQKCTGEWKDSTSRCLLIFLAEGFGFYDAFLFFMKRSPEFVL